MWCESNFLFEEHKMRPVEYCKKRIIRFHRVFSEIFKFLCKSSLFGDLENFWGLEKIRFFCFCNMRCFFFDKNVIRHVRNLFVTKHQMSEIFAHFRQPWVNPFSMILGLKNSSEPIFQRYGLLFLKIALILVKICSKSIT